MLNRYLTKIKSSKLKRTYLQSKGCVGMRVAETCCWETLSRLPYKMPVRASSRSHRQSREYWEEYNEHAERKNRTKGNCRHLRALQDDDDQLEIPGTCKK